MDAKTKDLTSLVELSQKEAEAQPQVVADSHAIPEGNFLAVTPLDESGVPIQNDFENPIINPLDGPAILSDGTGVSLQAPTVAGQTESVAALSDSTSISTESTPETALNEIKEIAEKVAIGHPRVEANPAYHLKARFPKLGPDRAAAVDRIEEVLSSDDYGVQFKDVMIQIEMGRLFLPSLSEFAAVEIAQKLRDVVDDIEIIDATDVNEDRIDDADIYKTPSERKDSRDLLLEPTETSDLLTANLDHFEDFKIQKTISVVSTSCTLTSEGQMSEQAQVLLEELKMKAIDLRGNALIGVQYDLKPNEQKNRFLLIATATIVQLVAK